MIYYRYNGFHDEDDEICTAYACDVKGEPTHSVVEMRQGDLIMFLAEKETSRHSIGLHLNSCQLMLFTKHWAHYERFLYESL